MSRLRDDVKPAILSENRRWRGASLRLAGKRLGDVKAGLAREVVDLLVEVEFRRRGDLGGGRRERATFRVVGVRHGDARKHHWYVTNVLVALFSPAEIARTYAARWEVEVIFRELKTHLRIATELAVVLAGAMVTMERRRGWHALLSGEGADHLAADPSFDDRRGGLEAAEAGPCIPGVPAPPVPTPPCAHSTTRASIRGGSGR